MSDPSDTTVPRRRKRRRNASAATPAAEPAVQVLLEQALHPDPVALDAEAAEAEAPVAATPVAKPPRRRGGRAATPAPTAASAPAKVPPKRRGRKTAPAEIVPVAEAAAIEAVAAETAMVETPVAAHSATTEAMARDEAAPVAVVEVVQVDVAPDRDIEPIADAWLSAPSPVAAWHGDAPVRAADGDAPMASSSDHEGERVDHEHHDPAHRDHEAPHEDEASASGHAPPPAPPAGQAPPHAPVPHHWVYLALGLFLAAIGFGVWGTWTVFFAGGDGGGNGAAALRTRSDRLSQQVSTLRRSDQISRDANRDLERTLAERDEEIASLRADIAFYERFVGATGQRRGLSVHDLEMRRQDGDAWHFVATLTQNVNRGAVNSGRLTLSVEGTRRDRMERLAWTALRKQSNAPGADYSFKYFQQLEGEILLPADFKPLRVTVRLVPQGGAAVEQSFPWPETLHSVAGG